VRHVKPHLPLRLKAPQFVRLLCAALVSVALPSLAQTEGVHPYAAYSLAYSDNVFGLPSREAAVALTGSAKMSDLSRAAQGGVQFKKTLGRQSVVANISVSDVKYDRFTQLDYLGRNYLATWNWSFGNYLDGAVSTSYVRALSAFEDFHSPVRRLQTERQNRADFRWRFHPRFRARGAIGHYDVSYGGNSSRAADRDESSGELGLDYVQTAGNSIGLLARRMKGSYLFPLSVGTSVSASDYEQNEMRARIDWSVSGASRFQFSGGIVSRQHKTVAARDFRGGNARATLEWELAKKTQLVASTWRELGIVDDLVTAYSVNKGASFGPRWVISQKVQTDIQLRYESRAFRSSGILPLAEVSGDALRSIQWTANYVPTPQWLLQSSAFHMKKDGYGRLADFRRNSATLTLQYQF
jgi:exopolysaccharide biosynthesis operon protein EpsL